MVTDGTTTELLTGGVAVLIAASVRPCTNVDGAVDDGTEVGRCRLKNDNKVGLFDSFSCL
jgi:hypothetical protein